MNTMKWLIKREFWEHRGGFFWAPLIAGSIAILFSLVAAVAGTMLSKHNGVIIDDGDASEIAEAMGAVGDVALLSGISIALAILAFVVFFYCLASLYDDRRDRSILFWKSLPLSDGQMVLSKLAWALFLAPLIALGVGMVIGLAFWVISMLTTTINGVPGAGSILVHSHPFRIMGSMLLMLPVQALWSLPTVGWLMFCSAWSRRIPFLWATMLPILGCALISFTDIFQGVEIPHDTLWYTVAYRGLLSAVPGSWAPTLQGPAIEVHGPEQIPDIFSAAHTLELLGKADIWIGAAVGVALLLAATRMRRWRDEG
ncbi:ABC transporter permease [Arenimonas fontis]|uniref:ABC transporter permease n=1 Tax=Arenimonas fontis TaxID=2608255 RepID=A0A5B2ZDM2_9GAMM|nr:ABC transporter permease [Arenimonas fontis]KAA2286119.1 ABC transporter permease [Arenimonas fontis]